MIVVHQDLDPSHYVYSTLSPLRAMQTAQDDYAAQARLMAWLRGRGTQHSIILWETATDVQVLPR